MKQFATFTLLSAAAVTAAVAVVTSLGLEETMRSAALLGVGLSGASGGIALVVKRRTLERKGLSAAFTAIGTMFAVRGLLLAAGLTVVVRGGGESLAVAFVAAFFAVYFVQQTLELSWVATAAKASKGAPAT
jgi:hypothetical protein